MRGGLRDSMAGWLAVHHPEKKLIGIGLPDAFIGHGKPGELENQTGLGLRDIELLLRELLRSHSF
jgi:deoxyxylulose-5-phosphate synthase